MHTLKYGVCHTSPKATEFFQHRCVTKVSADAKSVSKRASQPQAILKLQPPNSLDYRVRYEPQSLLFIVIHLRLIQLLRINFSLPLSNEIYVSNLNQSNLKLEQSVQPSSYMKKKFVSNKKMA